MLLRLYNYEYGCEYELIFPHEIPDSIVLTREEILSTMHTDKSIKMLTGRMKKEYTFSYIGGELHLSPGSWYKGEDPNIHFWRKIK